MESSFLMPEIYRGGGDFRQLIRHISKTVQERRIVSVKVE